MIKVKEAKASKSRRYNFDAEIRDLRAILNWYRETYNYKYAVPIIAKKLRQVGTLTKDKKIKEKLSADEFILFFNALPPFYKDIALVQSRIAGRISEVAGLQIPSLDFENRIITIKEVVVYGRKKEFVELKSLPKSGEIRKCLLTDDCLEVLLRRVNLKAPSSNYVFHVDGQPLKYRSVQHAYDKALRDVDLYKKTSGTHMIRHFTATLTRLVCGNLDSVQAVTGHKSLKLVQNYGALSGSLQGDSMFKVEEFLRSKTHPVDERCAKDVQGLKTGKLVKDSESLS